ncbi:hypothetical protein AXF42_Ash012979 [Apostasia shenzhenica]|uniref:Uncharacterized protein n=1 Tax=Apostasia shenzhenica TaxID=1088818 RepID=A0A2I0AS10_9ASPA|nr:hypothetical protein AXF42_Ash012979 [Apostasia shenzhenica]
MAYTKALQLLYLASPHKLPVYLNPPKCSRKWKKLARAIGQRNASEKDPSINPSKRSRDDVLMELSKINNVEISRRRLNQAFDPADGQEILEIHLSDTKDGEIHIPGESVGNGVGTSTGDDHNLICRAIWQLKFPSKVWEAAKRMDIDVETKLPNNGSSWFIESILNKSEFLCCRLLGDVDE